MFALLAWLVQHAGLTRLFSHLHDLQLLILHSGSAGYALYILLFIIATLCLMPGRALVIVGGMIFGPWLGTLLSLIAATVASSLSFLLARWLGREALQRYCGHHAVFQAFERGIARSGCDFLIFTRLVPLFPYNLQNYAYGLTAIPFWSFTFISTIATLPGLFIYTFMASELARDGITLAFIGKLSIAGLMLFVLTQAARRYGRYKRISVATSAVSDKNG
ncbi:TPA: TVP38/TMEM64 family protein [Klebsiella aerogenes]|nr:TVP38/TMEM64 family protein [Klebsiella aerogenes]HBQ1687826.1 TVP38/TMEM64 family protein [Klebsiella aerogenes]